MYSPVLNSCSTALQRSLFNLRKLEEPEEEQNLTQDQYLVQNLSISDLGLHVLLKMIVIFLVSENI